ncbi:MAG: peptidoglycan bridge formation glycyltransferase FemA/FemB family protein [Pseudomonadales bacterium]|nr:peptidoglycan bridge formation glycyltransferase FemA/FemB family protein [Candidatus Woesebacteria bacterium]MCB9802264.1 peptidoglycan bridge formation glycyltransferase FemA/FemB family protein [Pseudomonadales bacterium]
MIIRPIREDEKDRYNSVVGHPLQRWEWGEFRKRTGVAVERVGFYQNNTLKSALQVTFHPLPNIPLFAGKTIGYLPKGPMPDEDQLAAIRQLGAKHNAVFVKLEPNVSRPITATSAHQSITDFLTENGAVRGKPLFTKYSFVLDLSPTQETLFENLNSKTRYNVRLALKKGVEIFENTSIEGVEQFIAILQETTQRQAFYAHSPSYFRDMWKTLGKSGMIRIFNAVYQDTVLASWIVFVTNDTLYYPYGSSRSVHRDVMASNLLMWEMIVLGKKEGCTSFDMWGSLGPKPDKTDAWYGFHRFKKGYGGELREFIGTYDLVLNHQLYPWYRRGEALRWQYLRLRKKLPF